MDANNCTGWLNLSVSFFMENYGVYQFYGYICKIVMMY